MISNGTKLHIERETKAENGKLWGYTIVGNNGGWVFLGHCSKISQANPEINVAPIITAFVLLRKNNKK